MQKTLGIVAPLASLILFVAVAASSKITLPVLGAYGVVALFIVPPFTPFFYRRWLRHRFPQERVPRIVSWMIYVYPTVVVAVVLMMTFRPLGGKGWQGDEFTTFGANQIFGIFGIVATFLVILAVSARRKIQTYRKCPYCISHIPREASRCKYCTAPVEPEKRRARITQQPTVAITSSGGNFKRSPMNYARPGHRKNFGKLSVPRVADGDAGVRTRPLPSEIDARRRADPTV